MHIGFQRSGRRDQSDGASGSRGRGEYEVVGDHSGLSALDLEGCAFFLNWPDGVVRNTGLELDPATSGKPRLRSSRQDRFQIGRMVAAMLLLPDPRREFSGTGSSPAVAKLKGYVMARLGFGPNTEFAVVADRVTIDPTFVLLMNLGHSESIGVDWRWKRIDAVYATKDRLHPDIANQLALHQNYLASGRDVDKALTSIVKELAESIEDHDPTFSRDDDPLPRLEEMAGLVVAEGPTLPAPHELGEDEPEVSARSAHEYRLARARGASARRFSDEVRDAYGHRCAFCGIVLGGVRGIMSGVEAAHILAWNRYDLDVIQNGIALCRTHHWAFDAALMVPEVHNGSYRIRLTSLADQFDAASVAMLGIDRGVIPEEWLPGDPSRRPSSTYLETLYADLAITFLA